MFPVNVFLFKLRSIIEVGIQYSCIYFETQKHTWGRLSKFMYLTSNSRDFLFIKLIYLCSNSEVYRKQIFKLMYFIQNKNYTWGRLSMSMLFFETQKYIWSRLSKVMYLCSHSEVFWSGFPKLIYFFLNSEVYLKYTSFQQKSRSTNQVLMKHKQSTFFYCFYTSLYFFLGSSL